MSILDMSDEDMLAMTDAELDALVAAEEAKSKEGTEVPDEVVEVDDEPEVTTQEDDDPETPTQPEQEPEGEPGEGAEAPDAQAEGDDKQPEAGEPVPKTELAKPEDKPTERDYKAELAKVLAPFKANGRDIQVDSVEDAIQLMQKGANYHKKMEGIKPRLAQLKLLEQQGLLEGDKLNFLIDLAKGDKGAINRLIKEHSVDTLELDGDKAKDYQANDYVADEVAVDVDNVLDDLRETSQFGKLMDTVGNKWDNASRKAILAAPDTLRDISAHMESGIYELVQDRVATERALGRLNGLSSLDAYRTVGERMYKEGKFNGTGSATTPPPKVAAVVSAPVTKPVSDEKKKQKLAASPSGKKAVAKVEANYDPLAMSDEDFLKLHG